MRLAFWFLIGIGCGLFVEAVSPKHHGVWRRFVSGQIIYWTLVLVAYA